MPSLLLFCLKHPILKWVWTLILRRSPAKQAHAVQHPFSCRVNPHTT